MTRVNGGAWNTDDFPLSDAARAVPQAAVEAVLSATDDAREEALDDWGQFHDHGIDMAEWMVRVAIAAYESWSLEAARRRRA